MSSSLHLFAIRPGSSVAAVVGRTNDHGWWTIVGSIARSIVGRANNNNSLVYVSFDFGLHVLGAIERSKVLRLGRIIWIGRVDGTKLHVHCVHCAHSQHGQQE